MVSSRERVVVREAGLGLLAGNIPSRLRVN